ncbi:MAG: GntR family transcriptional regulator [Lachnospiraceae bacterium]
MKETPKILKHVQVYDTLYELIKNGSFKVGYKLPTEPELATKMGVSRVTLRHALALLQEDGLVANIRGKGNYVADPDSTSETQEYIKYIQHPFHVCCTKEIQDIEVAFRFQPPTDAITKIMKCETSLIVVAERWYKNGEDAVGFTLSFIPIETVSEYKIDFNDTDKFIQVLEKDMYNEALRAETQFTFSTTGNFSADKYDLSEQDNFIMILETIYSKDNKMLLTNKHYIPGDSFKLQINLIERFEL